MGARVQVIGAGPAGLAAALSVLQAGQPVTIFEKSKFPRHKVCGEFVSPAACAVLEDLGALSAIESVAPARMRRMVLRFGEREVAARLEEPAWGVSRYALDSALLGCVEGKGAALIRGCARPGTGPAVLATGRTAIAPPGSRIFGFKAHFCGPVDDAVELYFLGPRSYAGVSPVEGGRTNVCGLAAEEDLRGVNFDIDAYVERYPALRNRLKPLHRCWPWLRVGPLVVGQRFRADPGIYPAGDRLSFADPFTGSGILSALFTGRLAGRAAAGNIPPASYLKECRSLLRSPFRVSAVIRAAIRTGWAARLAPLVPSSLLFQLTRPHQPG